MRWPLDSFTITQRFRENAAYKDNKGNVIDPYGYGWFGHTGVDLAAPENSPIKSPVTGKIIGVNKSNYHYLGGLYVIVREDSSLHREFYMGHCNKIDVSVGDQVTEGQVIAYVGRTGTNATGFHTHFQIREFNGGNLLDPEIVMEGENMADKIDLNIARQLAHGILGRNGIDGGQNALAGDSDADLNDNHVGKDLTNAYVNGLYNSQEAVNWRNKRIPAILQKLQNPQTPQNPQGNQELLNALKIVGKYL